MQAFFRFSELLQQVCFRREVFFLVPPEAALGLDPVLRVPPAGPALGREGISLETGSLSKPDSLIHASTTSFESLSNLPRLKLEGN